MTEVNQFIYSHAPNASTQDQGVVLNKVPYVNSVAVYTGDGAGAWSTTAIDSSNVQVFGNFVTVSSSVTLQTGNTVDGTNYNLKVDYLPISVSKQVDRVETSRELTDSSNSDHAYREAHATHSIYTVTDVFVYSIDEYGRRIEQLPKYSLSGSEVSDNVVYLDGTDAYFADSASRYTVEIEYISKLEAGAVNPNDHDYHQIHEVDDPENGSTIEDYFRNVVEEFAEGDVNDVATYFEDGVRWIDTSSNHEFAKVDGSWVNLTTA